MSDDKPDNAKLSAEGAEKLVEEVRFQFRRHGLGELSTREVMLVAAMCTFLADVSLGVAELVADVDEKTCETKRKRLRELRKRAGWVKP